MLPAKRRRRNSGELRHLHTELWASVLFLASVVDDPNAEMDARLKAAHGLVVTGGLYRNILIDVREERAQQRRAALKAVEAEEQLGCHVKAKVEANTVEDTADDTPDDWEDAVLQASAEGTLQALEQSRVLAGLPAPNKALVQAAVLADPAQPRRLTATAPKPVRPPTLPAVIVPDPEEDRLAALEGQVKDMLHAVKTHLRTSPNHAALAR
jgi:hypothetical protein